MLDNIIVIVTIKPSTALAWHRKLAARKWTFRQKPTGRPATIDEVRNLVIEMKTNNRRWGASYPPGFDETVHSISQNLFVTGYNSCAENPSCSDHEAISRIAVK